MKKHRIVFSLIMTLILSMSMAIPSFAASKVVKTTSSKGTAVVKEIRPPYMTMDTHRRLDTRLYHSTKKAPKVMKKGMKYNYKKETKFYKNGNISIKYNLTKKGYYSGMTCWAFRAKGKGTAKLKSLKADTKKKRFVATFTVDKPARFTRTPGTKTMTIKATAVKKGHLPKKGETYNYSWTSKTMDGYTGTHKQVTYRFTKSKKMGFKHSGLFYYDIIKLD